MGFNSGFKGLKFKTYIKIDIKTDPTCFGAIAIIRKRIIPAC